MTLVFFKANDVNITSVYANETLTLRTERRSLVASASSNLSRNSLWEKWHFIACSTLMVKCGKSKGMQEKVSIMGAPGRVAQSVGHLTRKSGVLGSIPGLATYFRFSFRFFKKGSCQLLAKVCARSTG